MPIAEMAHDDNDDWTIERLIEHLQLHTPYQERPAWIERLQTHFAAGNVLFMHRPPETKQC